MFHGSIVAVVTPFKENFDVDYEAYARLIDLHLESGTHAIVPCGCTGEAATLSHDEQKQVIRYCVERVAGRLPVIAGAGSNNTKEAVSLTRFAKEVGADAVLSITPYYNKPVPAGSSPTIRPSAMSTFRSCSTTFPGEQEPRSAQRPLRNSTKSPDCFRQGSLRQRRTSLRNPQQMRH